MMLLANIKDEARAWCLDGANSMRELNHKRSVLHVVLAGWSFLSLELLFCLGLLFLPLNLLPLVINQLNSRTPACSASKKKEYCMPISVCFYSYMPLSFVLFVV